jgi:hypothetical protein
VVESAVGWVAAWAAPLALEPAPRAAFAVVAGGLLGVGVVRTLGRGFPLAVGRGRLIRVVLLGSFAGFYLVFLIVSRSLYDAENPLDNRGYAPAYMALLVLGVSAVVHAFADARRRSDAVAAACISVGIVLVSGAYVQQLVDGVANKGYNDRRWRDSPTVDAVRAIQTATVYSNAPDAIYFLAGRRAETIPVRTDPLAARPYDGYPRALERLRRETASGAAVVVLFDDVDRTYLPGRDELMSAADLRVVRTTPDGAILGG